MLPPSSVEGEGPQHFRRVQVARALENAGASRTIILQYLPNPLSQLSGNHPEPRVFAIQSCFERPVFKRATIAHTSSVLLVHKHLLFAGNSSGLSLGVRLSMRQNPARVKRKVKLCDRF
jgi:hypothetical protein